MKGDNYLLFLALLICYWATVGAQTPNPYLGVADDSVQFPSIIRSEVKHAGVAFENMELFINSGILDTVYCMAEDRKRPGSIIFNDRGSLKSTDGNKVITIAGNPNLFGYRNGKASEARFEDVISSFVYYNDTHLVVSDSKNYCLRLFDLAQEVVSVYAGICTSSDYVAAGLLQSKFKYPTGLTYGREEPYDNNLYIIDKDHKAIRRIRKEFDFVFTLTPQINNNDVFLDMTGLTFDTSKKERLLVKSSYFMRWLTVTSWTASRETIYEASSQARVDNRDKDGLLADSYSASDSNIIAIGDNLYLQAGDPSRGRLRVIDLKHEGVSTICLEHGQSSRISFKAGAVDKCQLPNPYSVALVGNYIYVGGSSAIYRLSVRFNCDTDPPDVAHASWTRTQWKADYECNNGYVRQSGDATLFCAYKNKWLGTAIVCKNTRCRSFPNDPPNGWWNGDLTQVQLVCYGGYEHSSGDDKFTCVMAVWQGRMPTCSKKSIGCSDPPPKAVNGFYTGNNESVQATCNVDYELSSGSLRLTCVNNVWSGTPPVCTKISFGCAKMPSPVPNGRWTGNNETATIVCNSDYELTGGDQVHNCPNGVWVGARPTCSKISFGCPRMPLPVTNGRWTGNNVTATIVCNNYYELTSGDRTLTCPSGTWIGLSPVCSKKSFGCAALPPTIKNGNWKGNNVTVAYSCDSSYIIISGDEVLNCYNGEWEGTVPVCYRETVGCSGSPPNVRQGLWEGNNVSVTIQCITGYELEGIETTLTCINKLWTGNIPSCVAKKCTEFPPNPPNGKWTGGLEIVVLACDPGYRHLGGNDTMYCRLGEWKGIQPVCGKETAIGCSDPPPNVLNGKWVGNNQSVTLKCDDGFIFASGDNSLECQGKSWNGQLPSCNITDYDCLEPPPRVSNGVWIGNKASVSIECNPGYVMTLGDKTLTCPGEEWVGRVPVCFRNDSVGALEGAVECPYSLNWLGLSQSCENNLKTILIAGSVMFAALLCFVMAVFRRRRRRLILQGTEQSTIARQQSEIPQNLNIVVHKKNRSKSRMSVGADRRSLQSRNSQMTTKRSFRSKH